MPYLKIVTSQPLNDSAALLKKTSGEIARLLGKPERYVMVEAIGNAALLFGGSDAPAAYLELKNIGLDSKQTSALSKAMAELMHGELNVAPDRVYIEFANITGNLWGWNGGTF